MSDTQPDTSRRALGIFAVVLGIVAGAGYALALIVDSAKGPGLLVVQFAPMLAAFTALLVTQRNLRGIGWGLGRMRFWLVALTLPLVMVALVFALLIVFGFVTFQPEPFMSEAQTGLTDLIGGAPSSPWGIAALVLALNGTLGLIAAFPAIGEEVGWRGFLAPRLARRLGARRAAFVIRVIWAVYHFPLIHFMIAPELGVASWPILCTSLVAAIGLTAILNTLRLASGSVWPAVIFHAALNVHYQGFFQQVFQPVSDLAVYVANDYGAMIAVVSICAAVLLAGGVKKST